MHLSFFGQLAYREKTNEPLTSLDRRNTVELHGGVRAGGGRGREGWSGGPCRR